MKNNIWQDAVRTVERGRVTYIGTGRNKEHYEVGVDSEVVKVEVSKGGVTSLICDCKNHSTKDIFNFGLCSAKLSVIFYKLLEVRTNAKL